MKKLNLYFKYLPISLVFRILDNDYNFKFDIPDNDIGVSSHLINLSLIWDNTKEGNRYWEEWYHRFHRKPYTSNLKYLID